MSSNSTKCTILQVGRPLCIEERWLQDTRREHDFICRWVKVSIHHWWVHQPSLGIPLLSKCLPLLEYFTNPRTDYTFKEFCFVNKDKTVIQSNRSRGLCVRRKRIPNLNTNSIGLSIVGWIIKNLRFVSSHLFYTPFRQRLLLISHPSNEDFSVTPWKCQWYLKKSWVTLQIL